MLRLDKAEQWKENSPKRRHKSQRPTLSHTQDSHKNTKLNIAINTEKS